MPKTRQHTGQAVKEFGAAYRAKCSEAVVRITGCQDQLSVFYGLLAWSLHGEDCLADDTPSFECAVCIGGLLQRERGTDRDP